MGNFSIYQAKYVDGTKPRIVTLPALVSPPGEKSKTHTIVGAIAGASAAVTVLVAAILFLTFWWKSRKRRLNPSKESGRSIGPPSLQINTSKIAGLHEIASDHGSPQEVDDTGKLEIFDKESPSGSGQYISEMSDIKQSQIWEMPVSVTPLRQSRRSLRPAPVIAGEDRRRTPLKISRKLSIDTCTTFETTVTYPTVQTTIMASTPPSSVRSANSSTDTCWDKPLPPTPTLSGKYF